MKCKNCIFAYIPEPILNEKRQNVIKGIAGCSHLERTIILNDLSCDYFKSKSKKTEDKKDVNQTTI
jgi:hypothetical protein